MPNGIFQTSTAQSCATGAANTPALLFTAQIPGNSVANGNALRLVADLDAYNSGGAPLVCSATVKLNGVTVRTLDVYEGSDIDVTIWRTGNTQGETRDKALQGLSWAGGMALEVWGTSTQEGGCILQRAGVQR
tara:strand:- start:116 stop:514 length:399 start_codon:yes stop_codon:yes gene_type:complete